ncbi:uncharacterized protein [Arachis hypogaea]|nr:uncharacterized protein LOC112743921 isoform X2 [Arachis hypogaea]
MGGRESARQSRNCWVAVQPHPTFQPSSPPRARRAAASVRHTITPSRAVAKESSLSRDPRGEKLRDIEGGKRGSVTRGARPVAPPCANAVVLTVPPSPLPPRQSPSFMVEQRGRAREQSRCERSGAELGVQPPHPTVLASPAPPPLEPPCCAKLTLPPSEKAAIRTLTDSVSLSPVSGSVTAFLGGEVSRAAMPGSRKTPFTVTEIHCRGHLSHVEGGRAAGCRRTLPPPPKTAVESSVSGRVSMLAFRARCSQLPLSFQ